MFDIFGRNGLLAQTLPNFELREAQENMATAVAAALATNPNLKPDSSMIPSTESQITNTSNNRILVVEAETGIGKTLAYLIPAVLSRQKVVVSTGTLNLQEQILTREIPFIKRHIDPEMTAICVKGRQNYLCLYRWKLFSGKEKQKIFHDLDILDKIESWISRTESGDRMELPWLPDNSPLWRELSSTTSQCLGSHCPDDSICYVNKLRKKAAAARILIVNHHLFFSDLALRLAGHGEVLPRYESVIFDEAHHIENVATAFFGASFSHYQLLDLAHDIEKLATKTTPGKKQQNKLISDARGLMLEAEHFFNFFPEKRGKFPLFDFIAADPSWETRMDTITDKLYNLQKRIDDIAVNNEIWYSLTRRCDELLSNLQTVAYIPPSEAEQTADSYSYIRWFERREKTVALTASPIDIAAILRNSFYNKIKSCIFTSASLTVGRRFNYFLECLGLPQDTATMSLPSPFDYAERTLLYIPAHNGKYPFPQPRQESFLESVQQKIYEIILETNGRALVLFTSINGMRKAYEYLSVKLPYPVLIQGEAPKNALLETFQKQTDSVLLAVASFWEGINVPGESLSCVIIDKLPFEVPTDPIMKARTDKILREGGNPFLDFQVPRAILSLRQGVGRLMRASSDKGLLAIMDVRLFTKAYGKLFRESLPPSPITRSVSEIRTFFH